MDCAHLIVTFVRLLKEKKKSVRNPYDGFLLSLFLVVNNFIYDS
jgi:hypothetical protein